MFKNQIKCLKMMGYEVEDIKQMHLIRVSFRPVEDYVIIINMSYEEMLENFMVENIVRQINEHVKDFCKRFTNY